MMRIHVLEIPTPLLQLTLAASLQGKQLGYRASQLLTKSLIRTHHRSGGHDTGKQVLDDAHIQRGNHRDIAM